MSDARIQTFSGKIFDLLEPQPHMFDISDIAIGLARRGRWAPDPTRPPLRPHLEKGGMGAAVGVNRRPAVAYSFIIGRCRLRSSTALLWNTDIHELDAQLAR